MFEDNEKIINFNSVEHAKKQLRIQSLFLILRGVCTSIAVTANLMMWFANSQDETLDYLGIVMIASVVACFGYKIVKYVFLIFYFIFKSPIPFLFKIILVILAILFIAGMLYVGFSLFAIAALMEASIRYTAAREYLAENEYDQY